MTRIALAGGIGAGKTAVSARLTDLGYAVIDADVVAHHVTEPGQPAWRALRDAFGDAVLASDGTIDRAFLASVVFSDPAALRRLNAITHPYIGAEIVEQLDQVAGTVFVALPLFVPEHRAVLQLDEAWAIQVEPDTAVRRLCAGRGFSEADARARLASQMTNDERGALVDRVLWNEGSLEDLYEKIDVALRDAGVAGG